MAVTSCGRERAPNPTPTAPPSGEVLRFGYAAEPPTLDPLARGGASVATRDILRPVLPALFALTPALRPEPELVESMPRERDVSSDPFSVALRLREATWSDGVPITAADVRFSWERLREGTTGYRYRSLTDVEVTGERTFRLRFDRPVRRWWSLFSLDDMVLPAHAYSPEWDKEGPGVSGGPFRVAGWDEGLRVRLVRNDRYWGEGARVGGIDVLFVPDDETRLQLLERDELDVAFFEGDVNIGRRARAHGFEPTDEALRDGGASGAWGPTWWELDLDPARLPAGAAGTVVDALDPALAAEILEDSGQVMDGIPGRFPVAGAEADGLPAITGPWAGRGAGRASRPAQVRLAHPKGTAAALARWAYFRLRDRGISAELVGLDADAFERHVDGGDRAPVLIRLRRGADAPDAAAYAGASGEPGSSAAADADVVGAEAARSATNDAVVGLTEEAWSLAQERLAAGASAAPLARVRSWIVGRRGVVGPRATGTSTGPLWNAPRWRRT